MTRVLVIGDGKMGRAVAQVAGERGCDVVDMYGPAEMESNIPRGMADVAIEFTNPHSAVSNILQCLDASTPLLCGSTGWLDHLPEIRKICDENDVPTETLVPKKLGPAMCDTTGLLTNVPPWGTDEMTLKESGPEMGE